MSDDYDYGLEVERSEHDYDVLVAERDSLRDKLADLESETFAALRSVAGHDLAADMDAHKMGGTVTWSLARLTRLIRETRAQLAEAQRVPEDAELDALTTRLLAAEGRRRPDGTVWVKVHRPELVILLDALTALSRRVGEMEKDRERLADFVSGFLWMLDEGLLHRNCEHDAEPSYTLRSLRLTMWLKGAFDAARAKEAKPK